MCKERDGSLVCGVATDTSEEVVHFRCEFLPMESLFEEQASYNTFSDNYGL